MLGLGRTLKQRENHTSNAPNSKLRSHLPCQSHTYMLPAEKCQLLCWGFTASGCWENSNSNSNLDCIKSVSIQLSPIPIKMGAASHPERRDSQPEPYVPTAQIWNSPIAPLARPSNSLPKLCHMRSSIYPWGSNPPWLPYCSRRRTCAWSQKHTGPQRRGRRLWGSRFEKWFFVGGICTRLSPRGRRRLWGRRECQMLFFALEQCVGYCAN